VLDFERGGKSTDLCQVALDVETEADKRRTGLAIGILAAVFVGLFVAGSFVDPFQ
jgi:hypothetical protein